MERQIGLTNQQIANRLAQLRSLVEKIGKEKNQEIKNDSERGYSDLSLDVQLNTIDACANALLLQTNELAIYEKLKTLNVKS